MNNKQFSQVRGCLMNNRQFDKSEGVQRIIDSLTSQRVFTE